MSFNAKIKILQDNEWKNYAVCNIFTADKRLDEQLDGGELETYTETEDRIPDFSPAIANIIEKTTYTIPSFNAINIPPIASDNAPDGSGKFAYIWQKLITFSANYDDVLIEGKKASRFDYATEFALKDKNNKTYGYFRLKFYSNEKHKFTLDCNYYIYTDEEKRIIPEIQLKIEGQLVFEGLIVDTVEKRAANFYRHSLQFFEPTKRTEGLYIDGMAVTQPLEGTGKTIWNVLTRLINIYPLRTEGQQPIFELDTEWEEKLSEIQSPQYLWSARTSLWEVLKDIGSYFDAIPRLTLNDAQTDFTKITFDAVNEITETLDVIGYSSYGKSVDENSILSTLETTAENIIEENGAVDYFPSATNYITPRTNEYFRTTENAQIILPYRINELKKVYVKTSSLGTLTDVNASLAPVDISISAILNAEEIDVTDLVVEQKEWQTLETLEGSNASFVVGANNNYGKYKNNTFSYEQGHNIINLYGGEYHTILWFSIATYNALITSIVGRQLDKENENNKENLSKIYNYLGDNAKSNVDIRKVEFRVEYIPMTSAKITAPKYEHQLFKYSQNFNQRAEINSADAFGRNLLSTAQKMGVEYQTRVQFYDSLANIPLIGSALNIGDDTFIITSNVYELTNHQQIKVTHTLSKNWSMLSQYVGIDRKYRSTPIPAEYVDRELSYQDYCIVTDKLIDNSKNLSLLNDKSNNDSFIFSTDWNLSEGYGITNIFYFNKNNKQGAILKAISFATANSIVILGKPQNSLSAGLKIKNDETNFCQDTLYCDEDGTLNSSGGYLDVALGKKISNFDKMLFPASNDTGNYLDKVDELAYASFYVDKDAGEKLDFTYQLHYVTPLQNIIIGKGLAENSAFITYHAYNSSNNHVKKFKFWQLNKKLPKFAIKVSKGYGNASDVYVNDENLPFYTSTFFDGTGFNLTIQDSAFTQNAIGWAITDENDNLLIASNDINIKKLYFNYCHEYHGRNLEYIEE